MGKFIKIILVVIIIIIGYFLLDYYNNLILISDNQKSADIIFDKINDDENINKNNNNNKVIDNKKIVDDSLIKVVDNTIKPVIKTSKELLAEKMNVAIKNMDYQAFADYLKEVYKNNWQGEELFKTIESKLYMIGTDEYFKKGQIKKALSMADTIANKVFESWRFNYLKIISLEKLGLAQLANGNYDKADEYATKILNIEFRPEGVELHAKVSIARAKEAIANNNSAEAKNILNELKDYELKEATLVEINKLLSGL